jgi:transcriptional regulator with XRE-family HTH domain
VSDRISTNVRYLLWRQQVPKLQWVGWLTNRSSLGGAFVREVVYGRAADENIGETECGHLARVLGLEAEPDSLRFGDFANERCDVLKENLKHLLDTLGHGGKKALAAAFNIDPTTISRWLNGSSQPTDSTLKQLGTYFGIPSGTNLRVDPVFLSAEPVSLAERRRWLTARLEALSADEIRELYPALRRLLEEP